MYHDNGDLLAKGYSGHPPYQNDVQAQNLLAMGPIPEGKWTMVSVQETTEKHGPFVIVLEPDGESRVLIAAMGRDPDSFRIHGEREQPPPGYASDGCIILSPKALRESIWNSGDHELQTVAEVDPTN